MKNDILQTAFEKVNPSHPDKIADRIAGALVDLAYKKDENPKVAVELTIGHGECFIINETSVRLEQKEVEKIVQRITESKDINVRYIEVEQDEKLAKNQKEKIRCGDNGVEFLRANGLVSGGCLQEFVVNIVGIFVGQVEIQTLHGLEHCLFRVAHGELNVGALGGGNVRERSGFRAVGLAQALDLLNGAVQFGGAHVAAGVAHIGFHVQYLDKPFERDGEVAEGRGLNLVGTRTHGGNGARVGQIELV